MLIQTRTADDPVIAYRTWQVRGGADHQRLTGINALCPATWEGPLQVACCLARPIGARSGRRLCPCEQAPGSECASGGCGIWGYFDAADCHGHIAGVVLLWGRIIDVPARSGWPHSVRAEFARIESLAWRGDDPDDERFLRAFVARHDVALLDDLPDRTNLSSHIRLVPIQDEVADQVSTSSPRSRRVRWELGARHDDEVR